VIVFSIREPRFLTVANIRVMLTGVAVLWMISLGLTVVMLTGGFDLSLGSMLALSGFIFVGFYLHLGVPALAAVVLTVAAGALIGALVNGFLIGGLGMPFLVVTMEGAFPTVDRGFEEAAATLGALRARVFARVTLPMVVPSLVAGTVLCWARALGEFGATLLFGGNYPGRTQTMPTLVYQEFETDPQSAVAVSLLLMLVAVVVLGALRDVWLRPAAVA